jgi:hypothetical protein
MSENKFAKGGGTAKNSITFGDEEEIIPKMKENCRSSRSASYTALWRDLYSKCHNGIHFKLY